MDRELFDEDIASGVDGFVDELLERAGIHEPPVDALALARGHLGIAVCLDKSSANRGRAVSMAGRKVIYVRPEAREERLQWTVAHEIGEHRMQELIQRLDIAAEPGFAMFREALANLFADRLLVPSCWFRADVAQLRCDLLALKRRYRTASHEVIAWRFLDLPTPSVVTIVDQGAVAKRKSNRGAVSRQLESVEAECQRYVNYYSRPKRVREGSWTVWGWPIHEADWKREILRSVMDEDLVDEGLPARQGA